MTLEEAIARLKTAKEGFPMGYGAEEYYRALELGIAAIVFIIALRGNEVISSNIRLPGETEE